MVVMQNSYLVESYKRASEENNNPLNTESVSLDVLLNKSPLKILQDSSGKTREPAKMNDIITYSSSMMDKLEQIVIDKRYDATVGGSSLYLLKNRFKALDNVFFNSDSSLTISEDNLPRLLKVYDALEDYAKKSNFNQDPKKVDITKDYEKMMHSIESVISSMSSTYNYVLQLDRKSNIKIKKLIDILNYKNEEVKIWNICDKYDSSGALLKEGRITYVSKEIEKMTNEGVSVDELHDLNLLLAKVKTLSSGKFKRYYEQLNFLSEKIDPLIIKGSNDYNISPKFLYSDKRVVPTEVFFMDEFLNKYIKKKFKVILNNNKKTYANIYSAIRSFLTLNINNDKTLYNANLKVRESYKAIEGKNQNKVGFIKNYLLTNTPLIEEWSKIFSKVFLRRVMSIKGEDNSSWNIAAMNEVLKDESKFFFEFSKLEDREEVYSIATAKLKELIKDSDAQYINIIQGIIKETISVLPAVITGYYIRDKRDFDILEARKNLPILFKRSLIAVTKKIISFYSPEYYINCVTHSKEGFINYTANVLEDMKNGFLSRRLHHVVNH